MNLISVLIYLAVIGLVWYLVDTYLPLPPGVKVVIRVFAVLFLIVFLLQTVGFVGPFPLTIK